MEIDSALQELHKLKSFTTSSAECVGTDSNFLKTTSVDDRIQHASMPTMELDSALHKLGMLSSVTNSHLSYLEEKAKKRLVSHSMSSSPLCVVQMNPDFIKKFSVTKQLSASAESESKDLKPLESSRKSSTWKRRHRLSQYSPYLRRREKSIKPVITEYVFIPEKASPLELSLMDSGNKSNPSSPVKSQSSLTSQGSSLTRSRSLDDLEEIDCPPDCCCPCAAVRTDIDTVSQSISQLHVS